jgi:hypothetical protein
MSETIAKNLDGSILLGALACGLFNVVLILANPGFAAAVQLSAV